MKSKMTKQNKTQTNSKENENIIEFCSCVFYI